MSPVEGQAHDGRSTRMRAVRKNSWYSLFLWPAFRRLFLLGEKSSHVIAQLLETRQHIGTSDAMPRGVMRRPAAGSGANLQDILMNERHQNKPMDHLHCPLGSLREEAQRTAAIGLRIAMDSLRLRWSERGQMAYEEAKKTADKALAAWNEHIRNCEICRDVKPELVPARTNSGFVTAPTILL